MPLTDPCLKPTQPTPVDGGFVAKGPDTLAGTAILIPNSIDDLITASEAATLCGVTQTAIRKWAHRNQLTAAGIDHRGRKLYRVIDVARAEHTTRTRARR